MRLDDIMALIKEHSENSLLKTVLKDYAADRKELDARRRNFAPVEGKTFFYLFIDSSKRDNCQMQTGIVENEKDKVRCSNDTRAIGKRIDEALKSNSSVRTYETADGSKHDGCATLEARCLELYRALKALKPILEGEAKAKPRAKYTREAIKPALAIITQGEKTEREAK